MGIPFADKLPKPSEMVADTYDFVEQLLAAQRKFAEDVLHATAPLFYGDATPLPRRRAPQPSKASPVRAGPWPVTQPVAAGDKELPRRAAARLRAAVRRIAQYC